MIYLPPLRNPVRTIGGRTFDFDHEIVVMGIVNRTPDSFFDHGRTFVLEHAVERRSLPPTPGAGWVDIGGVPFSPDTPEVGSAEEVDRVVPVVEQVAEPATLSSLSTRSDLRSLPPALPRARP